MTSFEPPSFPPPPSLPSDWYFIAVSQGARASTSRPGKQIGREYGASAESKYQDWIDLIAGQQGPIYTKLSFTVDQPKPFSVHNQWLPPFILAIPPGEQMPILSSFDRFMPSITVHPQPAWLSPAGLTSNFTFGLDQKKPKGQKSVT
ncbi:hypothetical protein TESG_01366 [Trichophyton tonsurans CBS 112818]|uniref:Uncharacterized protein n=1 Tax=Trichophyton tonsurans (strain CBS 112818) TaxID=647933 RepID=F2RRC5_TRIT1|nr:hypothetical protein TESG_01366 [Trichophyton tonsurans CBS 112818]